MKNIGYDILNILADKSESIDIAFKTYDDYEDLAESIESCINETYEVPNVPQK